MSTACSSGGDAICVAAMLLNSGEADVMLVVSGESAHCPMQSSPLWHRRRHFLKIPDPLTACRPFDADRDGFVMGEGGGAIILETEEHARKRGAKILCSLAGYGNNTDGYHVTAPRPDGSGAVSCMQSALRKANVQAGGYWLYQHSRHIHPGRRPCGSWLPSKRCTAGKIKNSQCRRSLESKIPPVSSTKGNTGHLMGAGGITEVIACVKAIETGSPSANFELPYAGPCL